MRDPSPALSDPNSSEKTDGTIGVGRSFRAAWASLLVFAIVILVRIPFILIHHVQEDAFITFRTARHLAEQGDFSFNLHQHFPGTTSFIYTLIVAAIDLTLHSGFILGVQVFGTVCVAAACYLAARALTQDRGKWSLVWLLLACWPIALLVSYTGMETPLLLLALGIAVYALAREGNETLFVFSMFLFPLIRPDAVAYGLILAVGMFLVERRSAIRGLVALCCGGALLLLANRFTSGHLLPTTAMAKQIAYHPSHAPSAVFHLVIDLFLRQSFLLPIPSTYLIKISPAVLAITAVAFLYYFQNAEGRRQRILLLTIAGIVIVVPIAYAYGGVVFAWYLYPVNWLAMSVVIAAAVRLLSVLRSRPAIYRLSWGVLAVVWTSLNAMQWAKSLADATRDYHYRADIGRYLAEVSHGRGTLFLEPAGYIPYYSGLTTDDEVGLVSPRITSYITHDPIAWWSDYVEAVQPEFIVQRQSFAHFETFEGYTLAPAEQRWFTSHYRLLRRTHYTPSVYHPSPYLQKILAQAPIEDYLVYQRREVQSK
jgi:hypothetical protein